jgi:PAS domain S-box-containing protein
MTCIAVLVLLFAARMWSVEGVYKFLLLDAGHGEIVSIAGRLPAQSIEVMHAAFVRAYAPQTAVDHSVDRAIDAWVAQYDRVAQPLAQLCTGDDVLCRHFHTLEAQMLAVAASARAAAQAPLAERDAALGRLTSLQGEYGTGAQAWVDELAAHFRTETTTQRHMFIWWAAWQLFAATLVVVVIFEPFIRRLQRERSEMDRNTEVRHELLGRLQKMGSQLPGMVYQYRLRPDGITHFPYASEGIRKIFCVSPDSVREDSSGMFDLVHPDDKLRVREAIAESAAQLTHWRDEYRVRLADGGERWVLGNAAPEREPDGSVLWHGFITDVTERRNAIQAIADARTLLQSVLDAATDAAIIATDIKGLITLFNAGAERMLQYKADEMVGRLNPSVFHIQSEVIELSNQLTAQHGHPIEGFDALNYAARHGELAVRECTFVRKDRSTLTVSLSITAIRNAAGDINGYLGVATDVTERREARDNLQAAKEAAERANRAKSEFLATMSHEIRTPMNGVLGFANLLRDTPLDDEQRQFVRTIERSGQNLLTIINDILDFSKIEAGAMTLENIPFDLFDAIEEVVALMAGKAEEKHLELCLSIAPTVPERIVADPGRLKQILVNLIGNAIKFTNLGYVHVQVTTTRKDENYELQISVHDTGIGIPQAAQTVLFQKFTQADASTTRRFGGTGLGLAICRQLIGLMGGNIGMDSSPGAGSTFWFTVPVTIAAVDPVAAPTEISGRRVLIVDDLEMNRTVLQLQLSYWGAECTCVAGGRQALAVLEQSLAAGRQFDVALIDHLMPDINGADLGDMLHADSRFSGMKLILLTSAEQLGNAREQLERGFCAYLSKPVVRSRLLRDAMCRALLPPAAHPPKSAPPARGEIGAPAAPNVIRVLVAEDNSVNQMVAVRLLERLGCRVDVAGNGAEAVQMAARLPYSLIFMDCHMPEMDGFEATVEIRRRESGLGSTATPIVAVTASVLQEDRDRCLASGMDYIIGKPVQPAELAQVLGQFAHKNHATD